uniref:Uncharacterized protein n=1 Tax=Candidatus Kentrum sp. FM TaxID=2126340 RepID=A0A450RVE2_9GAMM|nr:MAG: hypothetical protein BECKFM1743A_GA0114220_1000414 [Candidatus Kentron sp. FM]VFJ43930.1 MAG: hypothetical protein BECKFM1743C_GA0114222_100065 [Candidatus Kentron sp. FM]VFK07344.1 MAG: hypothetical protein BECKFM1743B_GA0114221_100387 [Candidatus Kentron sp. FM]
MRLTPHDFRNPSVEQPAGSWPMAWMDMAGATASRIETRNGHDNCMVIAIRVGQKMHNSGREQ